MTTVQIQNGPSYQVIWHTGMTGQQALQAAYNASTSTGDFTFSLQYYGDQLGYLVDMINETYDTFRSKYEPYFFWEFLINGTPSSKGIDTALLKDKDTLTFQFTTYNPNTHNDTTLQSKFKMKKLLATV